MKSRRASIKHVSLFTGLYLLLAIWLSLASSNAEFLFYIGVVVVLAFCVWMLNVKVALSRGTLWCLSAWGLMHMVGGLVPVPAGWPYNGTKAVFYSWWLIPNYLKYDHIVHAFGFGICTWICWQALKPALKNTQPRFGVLLLCVLGGMGLGAFNEVIEFAAVLLIPDTNVGGYNNTGWDLVANLCGTVIAALMIRYSKQHD